jgi:hypothetical protein
VVQRKVSKFEECFFINFAMEMLLWCVPVPNTL